MVSVKLGLLGCSSVAEYAIIAPAREGVAQDNIRWDYTLGGGSNMDAGCYCVNFLRFLLGEPIQIIDAQAELMSHLVDASMRAELKFPNGVKGSFYCSHIDEGDCLRINAVVTGAKSSLNVSNQFATHMGASLQVVTDGNATTDFESTVPTYYYQAKEFSAAIRNGVRLRTPAADGVLNLGLIDDIYRATGLPVRDKN
jgi:predicted dehydrogenase